MSNKRISAPISVGNIHLLNGGCGIQRMGHSKKEIELKFRLHKKFCQACRQAVVLDISQERNDEVEEHGIESKIIDASKNLLEIVTRIRQISGAIIP